MKSNMQVHYLLTNGMITTENYKCTEKNYPR